MSSICDHSSGDSRSPLRLGVVGLGRGFALTARGLFDHPDISVVAAASRNGSAKEMFKGDFNGDCYETLAELCADTRIEMIYVATPHELHCEHVLTCAEAGKHVVVEKPLSFTLSDAKKMVSACERAGVHLVVGPSHSFDSPVLQAREVIDSGRLGEVRMIHALNSTDFLYRPRRPEELCTDRGGGVVFSQAIHQVDVVRRLLGETATDVFAITGNWDADRSTEGAYSALLRFNSGAFASLTYSGYARFDSDDWMHGISELGVVKPRDIYGAARRALNLTDDEAADKGKRRFNGLEGLPDPDYHEHFGPVIVYCDRGDLRLLPDGIELFEDQHRTHIPCAVGSVRQHFCTALVRTVRDNELPPQDGKWGLASLEICHAILTSHREQRSVSLNLQSH